jgi:hypothetical protein
MHLQMDFYSAHEASVLLATSASGDADEFGEILLFSCVSYWAAYMLWSKDRLRRTDLTALTVGLAAIAYGYRGASDFGHPEVELVKPRHEARRKQLLANLKYQSHKARFQMRSRGFSLIDKNLTPHSHYLATAPFVLRGHLALLHSTDERFLYLLSVASGECGRGCLDTEKRIPHTIALMGLTSTLRSHGFPT